MATAQKGDPLKKVKDSLNFKNKTVEKYSWPAYDELADDDIAKEWGRDAYDKEVKHMNRIGLLPGAPGGMPYFKQTGTMVAPERKKRKNPMDRL
tara:strand:- start:220 stop:501 length:282 start_codon:yes stop_codon:yes gene_type:complete